MMIKTIAMGAVDPIKFDNLVNEAIDDGWGIYKLCVDELGFTAFMTKEKSARDDYKSEQYSEEEHQEAMIDIRRMKMIQNKNQNNGS